MSFKASPTLPAQIKPEDLLSQGNKRIKTNEDKEKVLNWWSTIPNMYND
jgi:hypothetical protein